jgi:hypothetical protein
MAQSETLLPVETPQRSRPRTRVLYLLTAAAIAFLGVLVLGGTMLFISITG